MGYIDSFRHLHPDEVVYYFRLTFMHAFRLNTAHGTVDLGVRNCTEAGDLITL